MKNTAQAIVSMAKQPAMLKHACSDDGDDDDDDDGDGGVDDDDDAIQYNFIAKCQYNCTKNILWYQVHSSHIHSKHKTSLSYNNSK